jgi:hypothetical protein
MVFGFTHPGIEPTIYCTWGEHATHYNTHAVYVILGFQSSDY